MKRRIAWLAGAGIAYSSPHVFSVTDDFLAYPQYEVVFSESYILDKEASSRLSLSPSLSATSDHQSTSTSSQDASRSSQASSIPPSASGRPPSTDVLSLNSSPIPSDSASSYERMILDSTAYLCSVPSSPPAPLPNATATSLAAEEEAAELARATDRGWDLLQEMSGSCLYFISGWWSYQFCYSQSVKQFHQLPPGGNIPIFPPVEDPTTPSYILGRFGSKKINRHRLPAGGGEGGAIDGGLPPEEGEGSTTTIQAKGSSSSRYLSQKLTGGTTCDLTGVPRRVEIQFHCHPQSADRIGWIKEVSTCSYLMVIYTPRLCNDVAFLPEREEKAEQVICSEVITESQIDDWKRRKSREAEQLLIGQIESIAAPFTSSQKPKKVMVGDIEVGAQNLVGGEKGWLKVPERHPGQQVTFGKDGKPLPKSQAIAHQHKKEEGGAVHRLSDKEMEALGVDLKSADAAIKELKDMSQGKGWKLEVFWSDGRVVMRGVLEDGEKDGEGQGVDFEGVDIIVVGDGDGEGDREGEGGEEGEQEYEEEYRDEL